MIESMFFDVYERLSKETSYANPLDWYWWRANLLGLCTDSSVKRDFVFLPTRRDIQENMSFDCLPMGRWTTWLALLSDIKYSKRYKF